MSDASDAIDRGPGWPGIVALAGAAVWTVGKVVYAGQGRLGLPGLPEAGADAGGRQWGNVALGLACVLLCGLLLVSWHHRAVRRVVVGASAVAALAVGLGAVTATLVLVGVVAPAGPEPPIAAHLATVAGLWLWTVCWLVACVRQGRGDG